MAEQRRTSILVKKQKEAQEQDLSRSKSLGDQNPKIVDKEISSNRQYNKPPVNDKTVVDQTSATKNIRDSSWISSAFLVRATDLEEVDANNRFWSTADSKYTDTTIGGNIGINSRPQFTRYADPRKQGRLSIRNEVSVNSTSGNYGMGHYYSEAIDDNAQTIFMEFGVPKFSGMTRFLSLALDPNSSYLARTGRTSKAYLAGNAIGAFISTRAFPVIGAVYWVSKLGNKLLPLFTASSKYYYLKPAMHMYWSTVNEMVSNIAVNSGIMPAGLMKEDGDKLNKPMRVDTKSLEHLKTLLPDIFTADNYIDVFAIANRTQRLFNQQAKQDFENYSSDDVKQFDFTGYLKKAYIEKVAPLPSEKHSFTNWVRGILSDFPDEYEVNVNVDSADDLKGKMDEVEQQIEETGSSDVYKGYKINGDWINKFKEYYGATMTDGASFAVFKVNYTGTVNESFSTSTKEPAIQSAMNGMSGGARDIKFNLSGGSFTGGFIEDTLKSVIDETINFAKGGIDGLTLGFTNIITALLGGGFIDVPKQWDNSTVSLPKINYTMDLISPYGNTISQLQNIFIPLSMIMVGALPLATGKQSYTSPFLCNIFDRGRQHIKLGMIESLSISRGTTNLAFNTIGRPLGVEVSFSVVDLSSIMAMPISDSGLLSLDMGVDDDHLLSTYLNVITGRDLYSQRYIVPDAKLKWARTRNRVSAAFSAANWAMWSGEDMVSIMKVIAPGSSILVQQDY